MSDALRIAGMTIEFWQERDCCGPAGHGSHDEDNMVHVEIADGGGGPYLILSTDRWALEPQGVKDPMSIGKLQAAAWAAWRAAKDASGAKEPFDE